ncbi:FAD:protein FMN transferase [Paraglaciecola sp.]|uniref:FAD:protein FMN transferase n=1 Tax=Paraglaciecola sp. TaxID=1920173 RepID=UPI003EF25DC0
MKFILSRFKPAMLCAVFLCVLFACSKQASEVHLTGPTMGTVYNVKYAPSAAVTAKELKLQLDAELVAINQLMSTYIPDSELSRFNKWQSSEPFLLSSETLFVMKEAKRLGEMSDGVLDVTVGPLVNVWGFGPQNKPEKIPTPELIADIKSKIGLDKFSLQSSSATKLQPYLYVDLSTIAKGYGVDRLADILISYDIHNFLVEVGGEMRVSGKKLSGKPWAIAIEKPESYSRSIQKIISVGNNAVATSGDYRNYYEEDGVRYSHLINPETGYPIKHNLVSVTVIHPSSMTADGLATALNVMGKEKAIELSEKHDLAVLLISKEKEGFNEYTSPKFEKIVTIHE